jgi:hypothetical protein
VATLDYVIVSEYACIDSSGLVTIVGGSFDRVQAPKPGAGQQLFITLRVLLEETETSVPFKIKVALPQISSRSASGATPIRCTLPRWAHRRRSDRWGSRPATDQRSTRGTGQPGRQPDTDPALRGRVRPARRHVSWMLIRYSRHARNRMIERGVTDNDVQQCLKGCVQRTQTARQNQYKGDVDELRKWPTRRRTP